MQGPDVVGFEHSRSATPLVLLNIRAAHGPDRMRVHNFIGGSSAARCVLRSARRTCVRLLEWHGQHCHRSGLPRAIAFAIVRNMPLVLARARAGVHSGVVRAAGF